MRNGWLAPRESCPAHSFDENSTFEVGIVARYNFERKYLPDTSSNPPKPRGWSLVAAGLLLLALSVVVLYTGRGAFLSPLALVVVAAIGIAALLLQLRLRKDVSTSVHAPLWLNVLGLVFAIGAVSADFLHLSANVMMVAALGAVVCFAASGVAVIHALRKQGK